MVESFKITARELRRNLKIHVLMPDDYNQNEKRYPLIITFDGELFYNFIGEDFKVFHTEEITKDIKDNAILIFLHSPSNKAWRMSELNPYYNGDNKEVDTVLAFIFEEYITNTVLPLLKQRFRVLDNQIYLVGLNEGAICALNMVYKYKDYNEILIYGLAFICLLINGFGEGIYTIKLFWFIIMLILGYETKIRKQLCKT